MPTRQPNNCLVLKTKVRARYEESHSAPETDVSPHRGQAAHRKRGNSAVYKYPHRKPLTQNAAQSNQRVKQH
jgi:hypothetical protein